jgi:hypothetical protein
MNRSVYAADWLTMKHPRAASFLQGISASAVRLSPWLGFAILASVESREDRRVLFANSAVKGMLLADLDAAFGIDHRGGLRDLRHAHWPWLLGAWPAETRSHTWRAREDAVSVRAMNEWLIEHSQAQSTDLLASSGHHALFSCGREVLVDLLEDQSPSLTGG